MNWFLHLKIVQCLRLLWNIREMYLTIEQCARSLGRTRRIHCPDRDVSLKYCNHILYLGSGKILKEACQENNRRFRKRAELDTT